MLLNFYYFEVKWSELNWIELHCIEIYVAVPKTEWYDLYLWNIQQAHNISIFPTNSSFREPSKNGIRANPRKMCLIRVPLYVHRLMKRTRTFPNFIYRCISMHFEISLDQYSSFQNTNVIPKKASILFRVQQMCCLMYKMHTFFGMTYQGRTGYLKGGPDPPPSFWSAKMSLFYKSNLGK
jgi:hypothetical protein